MALCPVCSCLCDDIEVVKSANNIESLSNACRRGTAYFLNFNVDRLEPSIDGKKVEVEESIKSAITLLKNSRKVLIYGLANVDDEAQKIAFEIADKIPSILGDSSVYSFLVKKILAREIKTNTLDYVRDHADTIIYWGSDPSNSHPRHLSRYTYYPRGKYRQRGWEEDRYLIGIDVRDSSTSKMFKKFLKIKPSEDVDLIKALIISLSGKIPNTTLDKKTILELTSQLKKAKHGVICAGFGLAQAIYNNLELFKELLAKLNEIGEYIVIPMLEGANAFGFEKLMYEKKIDSTLEQLHRAILNSEVDLALIIKSDPVSELPNPLQKALLKIPLIAIDSRRTLTSSKAKITIPSAAASIEFSCSLYRMDGVMVRGEKLLDSRAMSDAEVLRRLREGI
ncbi:MAG: hypothetical protein QXJ68_01620 [Methanocellales archaeon]